MEMMEYKRAKLRNVIAFFHCVLYIAYSSILSDISKFSPYMYTYTLINSS